MPAVPRLVGLEVQPMRCGEVAFWFADVDPARARRITRGPESMGPRVMFGEIEARKRLQCF